MSTLLPPELLMKIFVEVHYMYHWHGMEKAPLCVAVSQVCRRWRTVALETSCLWTRLPLDSPKWVETCIARSRSNCLDVDASSIIYVGSPQAVIRRQSLLLIYPELFRIRVFDIGIDINCDGYRELLVEVFAGLSLHPALKLREFKIILRDYRSRDRPPNRLPSSLFASQRLASLESMALSCCKLTLSWSRTFIAPTLRSLSLYESLLWENVDEMVQFFGLTPNLESLELTVIINYTRCWFNTTASSTYRYKYASLPKLKRLDVSTRLLEAIALLSYLSMCPTTSLKMNVLGEDWSLTNPGEAELAETYDRGRQAIRDHFATSVASGHGHTHLRILYRGVYSPCTERVGQLHNNAAFRDSPTFVPVEPAPFTVEFGVPKHSPHLLRPAYAMILEQPILQTATTICIEGTLLPETWSCLKHWTAVEKLVLSKAREDPRTWTLLNFVFALRSQEICLFPALRELYIEDAVIVKPDEPENEQDGSENGSDASYHGADENDETDGLGDEMDVYVDGEGLTGMDAQEFVAVSRLLAVYERFERLVLTRCTMSAQTFQAIKDELGEGRVQGNVRSPEEELQALEESRRETHRISELAKQGLLRMPGAPCWG